MKMRVHRIGHRMLYGVRATSTETSEAAREAKLRHEFVQAVPSAGRLVGSELVLHREHTAEGVELHFSLVERVTTPLLFMGHHAVPSRAAGEAAVDPFELDVQCIVRDLGSLRSRLALAASPLVTAEQLRDPDPSEVDAQALRRLFRRRARQFVVPSAEGDRTIELPARPRHLPVAQVVEISASVTALTPGRVHLQHAAAVADFEGVRWDHHLRPRELPQQIVAVRPAGMSANDVQKLVACLDSRSRVQLRVKLSFDWADGTVSAVEAVTKGTDARPVAGRPSGQQPA
jgi:hypothetical protein